MAQTKVAVADVFRRHGDAYREAHDASLSTAQRRAMTAIELRPTAPDDDLRRILRFLYLSLFLSVVKVRYPIELVLARALEFFDVARALETSLPDRVAQVAPKADEDLPASGSYAQSRRFACSVTSRTLTNSPPSLKP